MTGSVGAAITAFAPGRVNLIGEHTDYTGGLVLPMALDAGVTISGRRTADARLRLASSQQDIDLDLALPIVGDPGAAEPEWGRFIAAVAADLGLGPDDGFTGTVDSTLPAGGTGLSSSSALTCAALLAFGPDGDRNMLAEQARRIESAATGVNTGIMDQLSSLRGVAGHCLMIDCATLAVEPVPVPDDVEVLVVHSGQPRILAGSAYNERRATCEAIEAKIGPLRQATLEDVEALADPVMRRRGRHVVSENARVRAMVEALHTGRLDLAGQILAEGHRSLSEDYEVSTPIVDSQQARVAAMPGVIGARLTGGGFGGSLVALAEPGTTLDIEEWWMRARPGDGAHRTISD